MYRVLTGKQRSLVFPVMANACVKINYNDNIPVGADELYQTADDITYGIWGHEDSFTIEATITPYDVNGYGRHSVGSHILSPLSTEKVMPAPTGDQLASPDNYLSDLYMARADRFTHEMAVFHSTNAQLYLVNTTAHNENSPAQYKIRFMVNIGSTAITLDSPTVFTSVFGKSLTTPTDTDSIGLDLHGKVKYDNSANIIGQISNLILVAGDKTGVFHEDQELFILDGFSVKSIGTVATTPVFGSSDTTVTLNATYPTSLVGEDIYLPTTKHPAYISNFNHIAATFNQSTKEMNIYYDNKLVATTFHTSTDKFSFRANLTNEEDLFLGANGTNATGTDSAKINKQFMGELHEFAISAIASNNFNIFNLTPRYAHTLLYFRFEEVDE